MDFKFSENIIDGNSEHPEKAEDPIDVIELGSVNESKLEQPEKAEPPIDVTLLGIVIDVKAEQL